MVARIRVIRLERLRVPSGCDEKERILPLQCGDGKREPIEAALHRNAVGPEWACRSFPVDPAY